MTKLCLMNEPYRPCCPRGSGVRAGRCEHLLVEVTRKAIVAQMSTLPAQMRKSLTWDRGKELSEQVQLKNETGIAVYFADAHSPWQRPSNENTNGLLRQYFPKGTDLARWGAGELEAVAATLNNRPRKALGWKTPAEAWNEHVSLYELTGVAVHSDRGSQLRSRKFVRALASHKLLGSMGRVGAAGDNAAMESLFALLQKNVLDQRPWVTRAELRRAIILWIPSTNHKPPEQHTNSPSNPAALASAAGSPFATPCPQTI